MSTWQIFSDAGNSFRWEIYDRDLQINPDDEHFDSPNGSSRLPSMSDLVLQGCSKLLENRDEGVGSSPMFRTGLGKSVAVKQSSIAKALSVLGDDTGQVLARDNGCGSSNSLFQTGSGKTVNISSDGLVRAKTLLGLEEDNDNCIFQGLQHSVKPYNPNGPFGWKSPSHSEMRDCVSNCDIKDGTSVSRPLLASMSGSAGSRLKNQANPNVMQPEMQSSALKPPPIKFHTAGGRSISVSSDALKRARSLLGDPELGTFLNEEDADDSLFSFSKEARFNDILSNEGNDPCTPFSCEEMANNKNKSKSFVTPLRSSSNQVQLSVKSEHIISGNNLIKEFDAVHYDSVCRLNTNASSLEKRLSDRQGDPNTAAKSSSANGVSSRISPLGRSPARPLVDISNTIGTACTNNGQIANVKRILGKSSTSPFKRPRSYKFSTPLNKNVPLVPNGLSTLPSEHSSCRKRISSRYPFQISRMYVKEYFKAPPLHQNTLELLSDQVRCIKSTNAEKYMFHDESGLNCIGPEAFFHILAQSGASMQYASKEWVINHYKWIVWKLACYERSYPTKAAGKFLTVSNVLEELKYRYEREVNHGHRSSIKKILEGDASPSSMIVLCISAICSNCDLKNETSSMAAIGDECSNTTKVELTDGWYAMDAVLDVPLSKHLAAGKLFVGQKLRIWGAGLCGWVGPVPPLEVSRTVSLLLHGNGTYRAHWADRLGFCKGVGSPLAFRCIKCNGGPVPRTLVGVRRIYPVLYKERLGNGGSIVRSERMESKMVQLYNQRRATVVEGIISEFQRDIKGSHDYDDNDSEGAKILKILETAAEPEVLMAEMSPEQLTSFTTYQAKLEATRQANTDKAIEKALEDAGLGEREVTPFMRVRIVGLTKKICHGMDSPKEGLITIWNPTEKQQHELVEGQAYGIAGLVPFNSDADTLYLQARGSTTKWRPLSSQATEHFKPFHNPRKSVLLSNLGEVPLSSEFDIAAVVVHVGEVFTAPHQKKQWVFVTDGSISESQSEELSNSLLAISFCTPDINDGLFAPINSNLAGSTVCFCNLIKRAKDQLNHLWVAEATENSIYFLNSDPPHCAHLKNAAAFAQRWAKISSLTIDKLREKVLFIIGDCKS